MGISEINPPENNNNLSSNSLNQYENDSLSCLWPISGAIPEKHISKFRCPNFRSFTCRKPPPYEVIEYSPINLIENLHCTDNHSRNIVCHYTPAYDPPFWTDSPQPRLKDPNGQIMEKLTVASTLKSSYPLFEFKGDFYLKLIILECYGIHIKIIN